jgi:hypothetical protein
LRDSFFVQNSLPILAHMVATLLSHGWKKFTRSSAFAKEAAASVFLGIMALMMVGYTLALGFGLNYLITEGLNQPDSFLFVNMLLLYYFVVEFVMRYMIQNVPVLDIQPYLHLPIKRSRIMHFLLVKSLVHVMNFSVLLLFTPFALTVVSARFGAAAGSSWLLCIWAVSLSLHYIVILFKKKLDDSIWGILAIVLLFSGLATADYYHWFRLSDVSASIFSAAATASVIFPASLLMLAGLYFLIYQFFVQGVYPDEHFGKTISRKSQEFTFLKGLGNMGDWISLELKLILRNKRPRTVLYMSGMFLLYGLFFYTQDKYTQEMPSFLLFVGIFITGIFMINYGQFLFSWQASHFDFTLTRPVSLRQFIESKYWLLNTVTVFCFLLSIPYAYFGWNIVFNHLMLTLFNMGVNIFIVLNMAMWGPKKLNLTKGGSMNYEGIGAAQWVMGIPLLASPYVIYTPFAIAGRPDLGVMAIGLVGLIGIVLRPYLLNLTTKRLERLKYSIAEGFRKD